jgi:hypothetical protein
MMASGEVREWAVVRILTNARNVVEASAANLQRAAAAKDEALEFEYWPNVGVNMCHDDRNDSPAVVPAKAYFVLEAGQAVSEVWALATGEASSSSC